LVAGFVQRGKGALLVGARRGAGRTVRECKINHLFEGQRICGVQKTVRPEKQRQNRAGTRQPRA
jgi:hypothetical protein